MCIFLRTSHHDPYKCGGMCVCVGWGGGGGGLKDKAVKHMNNHKYAYFCQL